MFGAKTWFPDIASPGGVVLVMTLVLYPYVYLLARTAFSEQSASTVEAARALGLGELGVFWKVMLPLARPSIAAGLALALMEALADFGTVGIYGYSTFTVAIYRVWFGLFNREAATELASVLLCFTFGLLLLERCMRRRARFFQTEGSVRPIPPQPISRLACLDCCRHLWGGRGGCLSASGRPVAVLDRSPPWVDRAFDARYPMFLANTLHAGRRHRRHRCHRRCGPGLWPPSQPQPDRHLLHSFREHGVCTSRIGDRGWCAPPAGLRRSYVSTTFYDGRSGSPVVCCSRARW